MTGSTSFRKMNGLGNDFVVIDARVHPLALKASEIAAIADRSRGVGCDQVIALEPSDYADVFMRIWNADGGEVGACGNAARCPCRCTWMWWAKSSTPGAMAFASIKASSCSRR